jgi:CRP-like cAMP-binding protein
MNTPESNFESLFNYIEFKSSIQLSDGDKELTRGAFKIKHFRKRQYLLQEGDVSKYMAFIVKGAGRMYTVNENGQDNVIRFAIESWWLGDYESYNMNTPSMYNIEMIEDSDVLLIGRDALQDLTHQVPAIAQMIKEIDRSGTIANQKRIQAAISLGAEERYEQLVKTYPEFIRRFPQSMIASYLGISPETLSRIRKNLLRQ